MTNKNEMDGLFVKEQKRLLRIQWVAQQPFMGRILTMFRVSS